MHETAPIAVVQAWIDAANGQDIERLLELSDPDIEIVGPRGSAYGRAVLRDWLPRAGLSLTTRRTYLHGDVVVLDQHGTWRSTDPGGARGEADVASYFRVDDGLVVRYARFDSIEAALEHAGLTDRDEALPG